MKYLLLCFLAFYSTKTLSQSNSIQSTAAPTAISNRSPNVLQYTQSLKYCSDLVEAGFSDWRLPTLEDIEAYLSSGGIVPADGINTWLRGRLYPTNQVSNGSEGLLLTMDINGIGQVFSKIASANSTGTPGPIGTNFCNCVR